MLTTDLFLIAVQKLFITKMTGGLLITKAYLGNFIEALGQDVTRLCMV